MKQEKLVDIKKVKSWPFKENTVCMKRKLTVNFQYKKNFNLPHYSSHIEFLSESLIDL